jgi:ribonucleoside-diphosphate reductase alpha chain
MVQGHKYIKMVTSVIDYIFRDLAITYLKRHDLGQVKEDDLIGTNIAPLSSEQQNQEDNKNDETNTDVTLKAFLEKGFDNSYEEQYYKIEESDKQAVEDIEHMNREIAKNNGILEEAESARSKGYEGDPCPTCGSFALVRNGACLLCRVCGNSSGCS